MASMEEEQAQSFADTLGLSSLFSNCVEAIGLILPFHDGRKSESIQLAKIAIQQDRLLCWAGVLGVTSPPVSSGITQAVPRHAGLTNPDPTQPINFAPRDPRLDDLGNQVRVMEALHGIADPTLQPDHDELRKLYGLKHYKGARLTEQPFVNVLRLEAFREKVALLEDVTHTFEFPDLPRKKPRSLMPRWLIEDAELFDDYLRIITENVDYLIKFVDVQHEVDKAMKMDIRALGWHPSDLPVDISRTAWKLNIIREASVLQYPEYSTAAKEALDNVLGVWKGSQNYSEPQSPNPTIEEVALHTTEEADARLEAAKAEKDSKLGFFGFAPKFLRRKSVRPEGDRRKSYDGSSITTSTKSVDDSKRSNSTFATDLSQRAKRALDPPRSQSIHAMTEKEFHKSKGSEEVDGLVKVPTNTSAISRHDMYQGLYRLETKK